MKKLLYGIVCLLLCVAFVNAWTPPSDADFRNYYGLYNVTEATIANLTVSDSLTATLDNEGDLNVNSSVYWDGETSQANLNVNSSNYWDSLNTPSDINAGDINNDGTYILSSDEANLNVNSANYWDSLNSESDLTPSNFLIAGDSLSYATNTLNVDILENTITPFEIDSINASQVRNFDIAASDNYYYANIVNMSDESITYVDGRSIYSVIGGDQQVTIAGENITSGTVADARIASTIARDSELIPDTNETTRMNNIAGYSCSVDSFVDSFDDNANPSCTTIIDTNCSVTGSCPTNAYLDYSNAGSINVSIGNDICIEGDKCLSEVGTSAADITAVYTNGNYLNGGAESGDVNLFFNESKLNLTIDARDTDTTYSAGDFLSLTGTTFNVNDNWWNADGDIAADEISESKIGFSTTCGAGNHLYISGNDLACEADDDTTYTASGTLLDLTSETFSINEGTLTDDNFCNYEATGTQLECTNTANDILANSANIDASGNIEWEDASDLDSAGDVIDDSHNHVYSNIDSFTEANLYSILSDVSEFIETNDAATLDEVTLGDGGELNDNSTCTTLESPDGGTRLHVCN